LRFGDLLRLPNGLVRRSWHGQPSINRLVGRAC